MAEDEKLNSIADSSNSSDSSITDNSANDEFSSTSDNSDYIAVIIKNQNTIIENQYTAISIFATIAFLLVLFTGIYLTVKLGKFIQNFFI